MSEDAVFSLGLVSQEAGFNFLVFDAPGVGLTMWEKRIPRIYDAERFVTPAIDLLVKRSEVDPKRIVVVGPSFAGYLCLRAAAFEKRISAVIANPGIWLSGIGTSLAASPEEIKQNMIYYGVKTPEELVAIGEKFTMEGLADKISCPVLLLQGREDGLWGTVKLNEALKCPHKLRIIEPEEGIGGAIHCQKDNLHTQNKAIFDWLIEIGIVDKT